jgi:hypothetical protein
MNTIIVWYNQNALLVSKVVAENLKLNHGYIIRTEKEFWDILGANCTHNLLVCKSKLAPTN